MQLQSGSLLSGNKRFSLVDTFGSVPRRIGGAICRTPKILQDAGWRDAMYKKGRRWNNVRKV